MAEIVSSGRKRGRSGWKEAGVPENSESGTQTTQEGGNVGVPQKERKKRGKTCLQVLATGEKDKQLVEWNSRGQPVGDVSIRFLSTMGVIVREQVPINLDSWHDVKGSTKDNLWTLLMQKFIVDACFREVILQQMGKLWRSWKSDLSVEIRKIQESKSTKTERTNLLAKLRPPDVSLGEWDVFVKSRMSDKFLAISTRMRGIRAKQTLTHTLSRKGYARKEDEHVAGTLGLLA